jgi:hypothetical protein
MQTNKLIDSVDQLTTKELYFDHALHTWMTGVVGGTISPADVSVNSMGGLHMIPWGGSVVVPLSASTFVAPDASTGSGTIDVKPFASTIVATDPAVATPVSANEQIKTIRAEQSMYAGQ